MAKHPRQNPRRNTTRKATTRIQELYYTQHSTNKKEIFSTLLINSTHIFEDTVSVKSPNKNGCRVAAELRCNCDANGSLLCDRPARSSGAGRPPKGYAVVRWWQVGGPARISRSPSPPVSIISKRVRDLFERLTDFRELHRLKKAF